jgi:hypothetical protein
LTVLALIEQVQDILGSDSELQAHFRSDLEWMAKRKEQWQFHGFRVGLMGVTSSGKSTLVNALLDARLLPQAVRPSSNCLIVCEWGEHAEGAIHFHDSARRPVVVQGKAISKVLKEFADEATNPGNREGVKEIRLQSPAFPLGRGVSLVDTPGLDAYGHDDHEKLTLEVLLPTVDAVMFVTTCKANSDSKVSEYVGLARTAGKPVIVVQNMIDSVVAKLGAHGQVSESREKVLTKHLSRLQTVLKSALVDDVHIVQVSAQWALDGQRLLSGIDALVYDLRQKLTILEPRINEERLGQLRNRLQKLVKNEQPVANPAALHRKYKSDQVQLTQNADARTECYGRLVRRLTKIRKKTASQSDALQARVATLGKREVDEAHKLKSEVESWLRESPVELRLWNKDLMTQVRQDCSDLNVDIRDLDLVPRSVTTATSLRLNTTEKSGQRRVEQTGWFAKAKRAADFFDADWGYDKDTINWSEITDLEGFRSSIVTVSKLELSQVDHFIVQAMSRVDVVQETFAGEVEQQAQSIRGKISSTTDLAHRLTTVRRLNALLGIAPQIGSDAHVEIEPTHSTLGQGSSSHTTQPFAPAQITTALHEIDVPTMAIQMCRLSNLIAHRRFLAQRDEILKRVAQRRKVNARRILIAGFDAESVGDFVNRFWFDRLQSDITPLAPFTKIVIDDEAIDEVGVVCLSDTSEDPVRKVKNFLQIPATLFLLMDIQQIGASENLLKRSGIDFPGEHGATVLVIQSIRELENSATTAEALWELKKLVTRNRIKYIGVLVNDDEVSHSQVAAWLLATGTHRPTFTDETEFMRSLPNRVRPSAGKTIRSWNELSD